MTGHQVALIHSITMLSFRIWSRQRFWQATEDQDKSQALSLQW